MKTITVKYCTGDICVSHYYTLQHLINQALITNLLGGLMVGTTAIILAWWMVK